MSAQTYETFLRGQAEKAQYGVVIIPARTALDMADFIEKMRANGTDIYVGSMISRQAAIDAAHKNYDTILDFKSDGHTVADSFEDIINALPSEQPEPKIYWGYTSERPLADVEIVTRLRTIQRQVGGSYAIDRAIEIIEAVASKQPERDTPMKPEETTDHISVQNGRRAPQSES